MNISTEGIKTLQAYEGLRLKPYRDEGGKWTIGFGHLIREGENNLMNGITDQQAHQLFVNDLVPFVSRVNKYVTRPLNQRQFDALVIWDFNTGALRDSTLTKLINSGASGQAIYDFWIGHYITASGIPSPGLVSRRKREATMFFDTQQPPETQTASGSLLMPLFLIFSVGYAFRKFKLW